MSALNKVDTLVKASMLKYPSIFPSRMDVLSHIFMVNGSGYYFEPEEGVFTTGEDVEVPDKIARETNKNSHETIETIRLGRAFDDHVRDFIEANIDSLCKHNVRDMTGNSVFTLSSTFYEENGVLARLEKFLDGGNSPDDIDEDWRQALKQFCIWFMRTCTSDFHVYYEGDNAKSDHKQLLPAYNMCERILNKIQTQNDRDQLAAQKAVLRDIAMRIKQ